MIVNRSSTSGESSGHCQGGVPAIVKVAALARRASPSGDGRFPFAIPA
jgi:hypothetical protein